jgi:hypothetical protein
MVSEDSFLLLLQTQQNKNTVIGFAAGFEE